MGSGGLTYRCMRLGWSWGGLGLGCVGPESSLYSALSPRAIGGRKPVQVYHVRAVNAHREAGIIWLAIAVAFG